MEISIKISKGVDLRTFSDLFTPLPTVKQGDIVYLDIRVGSACRNLFMPSCRLLFPAQNLALLFVGALCWSLF